MDHVVGSFFAPQRCVSCKAVWGNIPRFRSEDSRASVARLRPGFNVGGLETRAFTGKLAAFDTACQAATGDAQAMAEPAAELRLTLLRSGRYSLPGALVATTAGGHDITKSEHIPTPAVRRLSLYLRQLETFHAVDRKTVASRELGAALGLSDAQVRKDLAYFGQFGYPGVGYRVDELIARVRSILGTDKMSSVLLVGVGNLGRALLAFRGFEKRGFRIVAAFDNDPAKIGSTVHGQRAFDVQPTSAMSASIQAEAVRVGILSVPAEAAQKVADEMVEAGIRGILNFAPVTLQVVEGVAVSSVDLAVHLEQLLFLQNDALATPIDR